jgi:hypothetical protein
MFPTNDDHQTQDERLDRMGRACLRAASLDEAEVERIASSPFLATRLRARIEAARRAKEESGDWLAIFGVAWRAAPAMCLAAALAVGGLLFAGGNNGDDTPTVSGIFTDEALLATSDSTVEDIYFDDTSALTQDEVLSTIVDEQERRTQR